jgi:ATP-binding cassette subfamily C protein CydD
VTVLTGPNGIGKSTALEAILGLTEPTSGRVTIDGIEVADLDHTAWWQQVAWLPQRPVIITGTVEENLNLFGHLVDYPSSSTACGFDDVLSTLPDGVHTTIGRAGVGLSLGQRQRLALVRALGSRAPVLLLDEPTAHLDAEAESNVLAAITARARAGDTVLIVAHRESVIAVADAVIHVEDRRHAQV